MEKRTLITPILENKLLRRRIYYDSKFCFTESEKNALISRLKCLAKNYSSSVDFKGFESKIVGDMKTLFLLAGRLQHPIDSKILDEEYDPFAEFSITEGNMELVRKFIAKHKSNCQKGISSEEVFKNVSFSINPFSLKSKGRKKCSLCGTNSHLYCQKCFVPVENFDPPNIELPLNLIILFDKRVGKSKSTSLQAKVLAKDRVKVFNRVNKVIRNLDPKETVLLYPSSDAQGIETLLENAKKAAHERSKFNKTGSKGIDLLKIKTVVVIEDVWRRSKSIANALSFLPKIMIRERKTLYWHFNRREKNFLSTIEAIYYFLKDYCEAMEELEVNIKETNLDDLLLLFAHNHSVISKRVDAEDVPAPKAWQVFRPGFLEKIKTEGS